MSRGRDRAGRARPSHCAKKSARPRRRPGLPDPASVVSVKTLTSPKGNRYRVLETDETDPNDRPEKPTEKGR